MKEILPHLLIHQPDWDSKRVGNYKQGGRGFVSTPDSGGLSQVSLALNILKPQTPAGSWAEEESRHTKVNEMLS